MEVSKLTILPTLWHYSLKNQRYLQPSVKQQHTLIRKPMTHFGGVFDGGCDYSCIYVMCPQSNTFRKGTPESINDSNKFIKWQWDLVKIHFVIMSGNYTVLNFRIALYYHTKMYKYTIKHFHRYLHTTYQSSHGHGLTADAMWHIPLSCGIFIQTHYNFQTSATQH